MHNTLSSVPFAVNGLGLLPPRPWDATQAERRRLTDRVADALTDGTNLAAMVKPRAVGVVDPRTDTVHVPQVIQPAVHDDDETLPDGHGGVYPAVWVSREEAEQLCRVVTKPEPEQKPPASTRLIEIQTWNVIGFAAIIMGALWVLSWSR